MRYIFLTLLVASFFSTNAKDGYRISVDFNGYANQKVFLAHYYGQPLPTIYRVDSADVDDKGHVVLKTAKKMIGGLYMIILNDNRRYFEFILDNGDDIKITANANQQKVIPQFSNSQVNKDFKSYTEYLESVGLKQRSILNEYQKATTKVDSIKIQQKISNLNLEISTYRTDYKTKNASSFLTTIFNALEETKIPSSLTEQEAAYQYYKAHYWDNVDLTDDRLVYTPILNGRLQEYFSELVSPVPDSFIKAADELIKRTETSKEVFKYALHWLAGFTQKSKQMGMDGVFVHLVENYYMKGKAYWLNEGTLNKYVKRAREIAPNVIGNIAPEMEMKDIDGNTISLHAIQANYTLLVFWSPDCGHCEEEIPRVDSVYNAIGLKDKGVTVVGFNIDKSSDKWSRIIKENNLGGWLHVHDPERTTKLRSLYDVYGTPSIYLLDKKKIIVGKKLDHTNIEQIFDILEHNSASNKQ